MIHIGTCSWAEKTLLESGEFYPADIKTAEDRLRYYSGHFRTVEVDSSYYAMPAPRTVSLWAERTPEDFIFHIKVYGALTGHGIIPKTLPKDLFNMLTEEDRKKKYIYIKDPGMLEAISERHVNVLEPLKRAGKLGLFVFQYPPWFHYRPSNLEYIMRCKDLLDGLPIAVEFRHGSWLTEKHAESILNFLENHDITYVSADEPQYGSLATVPFIPHVTTDTAYFRFHGRNRENWLKKGVETSLRYAYYYSEEELKGFADSVRSASKKAKKTYAMFNNCHGGFAVKNALSLKELIGLYGLNIFMACFLLI